MNGMVKLRPWASDMVFVKGKKVRTEEWVPIVSYDIYSNKVVERRYRPKLRRSKIDRGET